ncbi:MAG: hypothetical protein JFR38_09020 [Muribaculaceae bacterium]|nr:hypothetical protein [Muribaculaceae bacterium]
MNMLTALRVIIIIILVIMAAGGCFLMGRTHVAPWLPVGMALTSGVLFAMAINKAMRTLTGISRNGLRMVVLTAGCSVVVFFALLTANYAGAPSHTATTVRAEVVAKKVRTEYGTRRVGRGRYVRDSSRKIYHYEYTLRLPDGSTLVRHTDADGYVKLRVGRHENVELRRGALGWTVAR